MLNQWSLTLRLNSSRQEKKSIFGTWLGCVVKKQQLEFDFFVEGGMVSGCGRLTL